MAGKNKIMQAVVSFAGTIDPSLGKAMDNVAGHLDKVNWKAVAVGAAVGGIAVATGKAVVEAGKYLAELGDDYNKAMNQLSASTGATGGAIDRYNEWQVAALGRDINPDQLRKRILSPSWGENLTGAFRVDVVKPTYKALDDTQVAKFSGHLTVSHKVESEVV